MDFVDCKTLDHDYFNNNTIDSHFIIFEGGHKFFQEQTELIGKIRYSQLNFLVPIFIYETTIKYQLTDGFFDGFNSSIRNALTIQEKNKYLMGNNNSLGNTDAITYEYMFLAYYSTRNKKIEHESNFLHLQI